MNLPTTNLHDSLRTFASFGRRYIVIIFALFLLTVYSFLGWKIYALTRVEPNQTTISSKLQVAAVPHVDKDALAKVQQLQDNSVEVRTLFNDARSNPFQE